MRRWHCPDVEATRRLGAALAAELVPDGTLLIQGALGAGKTVLAQGVGEGLGIPREEVQSPTYTIVRHHSGAQGSLAHLDLYRLDADAVQAAGVEEILAGRGVKVVEWPERLSFPVEGATRIRITIEADGSRLVESRSGSSTESSPPAPGTP